MSMTIQRRTTKHRHIIDVCSASYTRIYIYVCMYKYIRHIRTMTIVVIFTDTENSRSI